MAPKEVTLESGAKLELGYASFEDGMALMQAVSKLTASFGGGEMNSMLLLSNPEVLRCLFACMKKCMLNGQKINQGTFEVDENRPHFIPASVEVMNYNIGVFTGGLSSS